MDKITEELFSSLIKRVDSLEEQIKRLTSKPAPAMNQNRSPWLATQAQLDLVANLGGTPNPNWTKKQVSEEIDKLKAQKVKPKQTEQPQTSSEEFSHSYDIPESTPLTQEEIDELGGEDALL